MKKINYLLFRLLIAGLLITSNSYAQTVTLSTTTDEVNGNTSSIAALNGSPGGAGISLREAILAANNEPNGSVVTITMPAGTFTTTIAGAAENLGVSGDIDVNVSASAGMKTVTINGAGAGVTIITGSTGERVFDVHAVSNSGSITFNLSGVTISNTTIASASGAALLLGRAGDISNISNCVFSGNSAPNSGAISQSSSLTVHDLTVTNCTFTNNTATSGGPGALNYNGIGNVTISGCTFSGNTAATQAGAINISGGGTGPVTTNILRNTFLNNTANGMQFGGAAVAINNAQTVNINFNRLVGNTSPNLVTVATPPNNGDGRVITATGGVISSLNVDNNWWGVNTGPVTTATSRSVFGATPTRWLNLRNTASPSSICVGATATITASFLSNNLSEAIAAGNLTALVGQPISFNTPVNGTLSGAQTTIQVAGTAAVTFTATAAGAGSANAVFVPSQENISVGSNPTITINNSPSTPTITPGSATTFCTGGSVVLSSSSATGYQWYVGGSPIGGEINQTYTANANGTYTVVVTSGGCSSAPSLGTMVTVNPTPSTPTITPGSATTFCTGGSVVLSSSSASGNQWYVGGNPIGGETNQTYTASTTGTYTVVVTSGGCSSAPSLGTVVTVNALPNVGITVSPSANVCAGSQVTLSGTGAGSYSWTGGITDGVPFVPAVSNTISQTNAALLVGLRKLVATYNSSIIQLRRSSDNDIQDFGLSGNDLDVAAINTWLGGATGFCTILYDQSGNGNHVTQTNPSLQPEFVANGVNGKPVLHFTAGHQMLNATNFTSPYTVVYAARQTGPNRQRVLSSVGNNWLLGWWAGNKSIAYFEGWVYTTVSPSDNSIYIYSGASNGVTSQFYENGNLIANNSAGVAPPNGIALGGWVAGNSEYSDCDFMDVMVYNTVLSNTDRTAAESSMSNYYNLAGIPRNILYTVTGTDGNGCSNTATQTITILQPTSSETTVAICNKYTWNGTDYKESGDYVFHTTNAAGCDSAATLHLTILSVTSTTSKTDATCFATGTGSITVNPTYGVAPFTYRIGTVGSYVPNNTFNNLKAGKYRVSILDVNGCAGITSQVTITQPVAVRGTASITNASCYGSINGSIAVSPSTGVGPYMYRLGDVGSYVNTNTFNNLKADAYRVYIKDANSCVGNFVVQVTQPTKVSGTSTKTDESCPGAKNGSITVNGTGGTPPYSYRFGGMGSFTSTNTFTNLKTGSYRVYVNDANNCSGFSILTTVGQTSGSCLSNMAKGIRNPDEVTTPTLLLSLSPNPATTNFTLSIRSVKQESVQVRVIDINGKTIYATKGLPEQTYRFGQSFAPGMYLIEVRQGDEVKTLKAVKVN